MKLNILASTSQIKSQEGTILGVGTLDALLDLADNMRKCGVNGDIYDLPNGSRNPCNASPFSINSGFALNKDDLNLFKIAEIKKDKKLYSILERFKKEHERNFHYTRRVNYALIRTISVYFLEECFEIFSHTRDEQREKRYLRFLEISSYWLDNYAIYEVYKEKEVDLADNDYRDLSSPKVVAFIKKYKKRIDYHKYVQFLCYRQRKSLMKKLKEKEVGVIVNLPFGVDLNSADVYFHPDVFDETMQVGCSPEPHHGYPEQAWGIAAYKECSEPLKKYLYARMHWLVRLGKGIFLDHLVGWCGQYVVPFEIPENSEYPHGEFLTEDYQERKKNIRWFLDIVLRAGLTVRGEVAGDHERVKATTAVIEELEEEGIDIKAMSVPRWKTGENHLILSADSYNENTLLMVETHDTSTLLQYLTNTKGDRDDFESKERILQFCNRFLALPFQSEDVPLTIDELDDSFFTEVFSRICLGTKADDVVFTLPSLISFLSKSARETSIYNNINVKPGTTSEVANEKGNWSFFSPAVETLWENKVIRNSLEQVCRSDIYQLDHFKEIGLKDGMFDAFRIISAVPGKRGVIFRSPKTKKWELYKDQFGSLGEPLLELAIHNKTGQKSWGKIDLSELIELETNSLYQFKDLANNGKIYKYTGQELKKNMLFFDLSAWNDHHFIVTKS